MLNVYDLNRRKTAVLQNAFNIVEEKTLNKIYSLEFTIPKEDIKEQYCQPRHYVRWGDNGELYRIIKPVVNRNDKSTITYSCEHVISTLIDKIMFGSVAYGGWNMRTEATINYLLSQQNVKNWTLGACEFDRRFEYLWEQENLLNALYAIPKEFAVPYKWEFDTTVYPWRLCLRKIDTSIHPDYYLRAKRNILSAGKSSDYTEICTRLYPLGYGEGINQLNIKSVNSGIPYIQSPANIVEQYGIVEKVLIDRRFENADSLLAYAQSMLEIYQTPSMSRTFAVTDLYQMTHSDIDHVEVGDVVKMVEDDTIAYVTKTRRRLDIAGDLQIELSTKATDIASTIADLADRVRIESVYAQGATQLYQYGKDANATPSKGMIMSLYFPSEMRQINKILMRFKLNKFRSYSQTTENAGATTRTSSEGGATTQTSTSGGGSTQTSTSGGGSTQTSTNGGGSTQTSTSGGGSTQTSTSGGATGNTSTNDGGPSMTFTASASETENANWSPYVSNNGGSSNLDTSSTAVDGTTGEAGKHNHNLWAYTGEVTPAASANYKHNHAINYTGGALENGGHKHSFTSNWHSHSFSVYKLKHTHSVIISFTNNDVNKSGFAHSHSFSIGGHTHNVTIPNHTHNVSIPNHTHDVTIPNHTHKVTIPNHTHDVTVPNHTHKVTIPNHTHDITIPAHSHSITAGIFESGNAQRFDIYINGTKKITVNATSYDGDITSWLLNNENQVPRDTWIDVEIRPNDLAYCQCSVFVQGFIQSRGGGNY